MPVHVTVVDIALMVFRWYYTENEIFLIAFIF